VKDVVDVDYSKYDFKEPEDYVYKSEKGLNVEKVIQISKMKGEPEWMTDLRVRAYETFKKRPIPSWGADLSKIDFDSIRYYIKPTDKQVDSWEALPQAVKDTFERLGVPEAERKFLAGVGAQYESEVVYHNMRKDLEKQGVIFSDVDTAIKEHPEIVKKYFGTVVPPNDNTFAALNSAVWSGGSFIYVPEGVKVEQPLHAYFRINAANMGQFERTLIVAEPYSDIHYVEGCLPAGELVSMGDSFQQIETIMAKDKVVSHAGERRAVSKTYVHIHSSDMLEIVPQSSGNAFRLTGEHPVLCVRRRDVLAGRKARNGWMEEVSTRRLVSSEPEFVRADELEPGDFLVYVAPGDTEDDPSLDEAVMKILGLYLAEGSVTSNKALGGIEMVQFSFGEGKKEAKLATELVGLIRSRGWKASISRPEGRYYSVTSYSKELVRLCVTNCGRGARTKRLSKAIMRLPPSKQRLLISYYWKGDGSVYVRHNGAKMRRTSTASYQLALQIQEILARCGVFANLTIRKGGEDTIHGRRTKRSDKTIIEYTQDKRMGEVRRSGNRFYVPIKRISRRPFNGPVYNLAVDRDESYLVRGFAVHNCTAPVYASDSLHAAVVELIAKKGAHIRYTTIQNWSKDVYNLVTKRAFAYEDARVEWIDGNIGSKVTMKYPSIYLLGRGARAEVLSIAMAGSGQHIDAGSKILHLAPDTSSRITSKSVSKDGGRTTYRGQLLVAKGATGVKSSVRCDALILDEKSKSDTYPYNMVSENDTVLTHEATVGKIGEDQLFYLMSRGLTENEALNAVVMGFMEPFTKELPMVYAIELNRLISLEMTNSVG